MYGYLFCRKISPCTHLLKPVFLLIFGKSQDFWTNVGKISKNKEFSHYKYMKIHACILIQACIFILFWEKPPPILLFKPVRVLETAE